MAVNQKRYHLYFPPIFFFFGCFNRDVIVMISDSSHALVNGTGGQFFLFIPVGLSLGTNAESRTNGHRFDGNDNCLGVLIWQGGFLRELLG